MPDVEKDSADLLVGYASALDVVRCHQAYHHLRSLKRFQHSTPTLSRSDISRIGPHTPTAATTTIMGTSPHYTSGQISLEDPWLRDLSRQYTSTQAISPQAIPRISARSAKSHIRKSDSAEQPRRFVDEAMRRQRSYPTLSSFAPTVGQLHTSPGVDSSTEFTRVKHEPDGDSSIPPLRLGWAYETHSPPSPNLSVSFFLVYLLGLTEHI